MIFALGVWLTLMAGILVGRRHPAARVRHAVVEALGEVGTLRAVDPLAATKPGLFEGRDTHESISSAIERIHARRG